MKLSKITPIAFAVAVASGSVGFAGQASAGVTVDEKKKVQLYGNVRFRGERDDRISSSDANQTRTRLRFRVRAGIKYQPNEQWSGELRLSTGKNGNSPYTTFNSGTEDSSSAMVFDRAYIAFAPVDGLSLIAGRTPLNFWQQNEQWWDTDRSPDALAVVYKTGGLTLNGNYTVLVDGARGSSWSEDVIATMYQAVYKGKTAGLNYTAALGGASLNKADLFPDKGGGSTGLQSDGHWIASLQAKGGKWLAGADMIKGNANVENTAVVAQGRYKITNKIQLRLYYYKVEAFSTLGDGMYSQDNWPNPNDNGVSNFQGIRYQLDYKIAKGTSLDLRYYDGERIVDTATLPGTASDALLNDKDRNRLQINITVKF